jgi:hypothetical protein
MAFFGRMIPVQVQKDANPFADTRGVFTSSTGEVKPHMNPARSDAAVETYSGAAKWHAERANQIAAKNPASPAVGAHHAASIAHRLAAASFDKAADTARNGNEPAAKQNYALAIDMAKDANAKSRDCTKYDPSGKLEQAQYAKKKKK